MVKRNTNFWRFFRRSTAVGLVLLLVLVGWPPVAAAKIKSDWSRVQIVTPGTRTTVLLYKNQAPREKRKIEGKFHSATPEAITLLLPDGQTRTVGKQGVEKVLVYRPIAKRYEGWVTAGVIGGIIAGAAAKSEAPSEPLPAGIGAAIVALVVGLPTVIVFLVAPKMRGIYNVPPGSRDSSNTAVTSSKPRSDQEPDNQGSSTRASDAKEEATDFIAVGSEGYFLSGKSGPELLRWQARRALIRQDLPLNLSSLPVHAHRSGID